MSAGITITLSPRRAPAGHPQIEVRRVARDRRPGVLALLGEHDMATAHDVGEALSALRGDVLVDLSGCSFIDSTTVCALLRDAARRRGEGGRLELLVPAANSGLVRTLEIVDMASAVAVHVSEP